MNELQSMSCTKPRKGEPPLNAAEVEGYLPQIPDWEILENQGVRQLTRMFEFSDFKSALQFTNRIGELAEQEDHHPAILTEWGKVTVTWWTHAVSGLHLNDFIAAAKSDQIYKN